MSALDIIEIPGYPGLFTRRIVVEMWQRAGSPPINDAGRLYAQQLDARLAYESGAGSPADDPRRPDKYPLAHVRFGALDVANWARSAMIAAGFEYPYDYEPWHGQLPNIYAYPLVTSIPASATTSAEPFNPVAILEASMSNPLVNVVAKYGAPQNSGTIWIGNDDGTFVRYDPPYNPNIRGVLSVAFFGGKGDQDLTPTVNEADFVAVKRIWATMCQKAPVAVKPKVSIITPTGGNADLTKPLPIAWTAPTEGTQQFVGIYRDLPTVQWFNGTDWQDGNVAFASSAQTVTLPGFAATAGATYRYHLTVSTSASPDLSDYAYVDLTHQAAEVIDPPKA